MQDDSRCPFCERIAAGAETVSSAAHFPDAFPVTSGHTLVVPRRHTADLFELTPQEQFDIWAAVCEVRSRLLDENADGINIGLNAGAAAGQTVEHVHVHVIPRRTGDTKDPRGGIRWVIPDRARYWEL